MYVKENRKVYDHEMKKDGSQVIEDEVSTDGIVDSVSNDYIHEAEDLDDTGSDELADNSSLNEEQLEDMDDDGGNETTADDSSDQIEDLEDEEGGASVDITAKNDVSSGNPDAVTDENEAENEDDTDDLERHIDSDELADSVNMDSDEMDDPENIDDANETNGLKSNVKKTAVTEKDMNSDPAKKVESADTESEMTDQEGLADVKQENSGKATSEDESKSGFKINRHNKGVGTDEDDSEVEETTLDEMTLTVCKHFRSTPVSSLA